MKNLRSSCRAKKPFLILPADNCQLQRYRGRIIRSLREIWPRSVMRSSSIGYSLTIAYLPARRTNKVYLSQIRQGIASNTKGTAFIVYEDVMDAKQACDKLNGFNFQNRYLVGKLCGLLILLLHKPTHKRLSKKHAQLTSCASIVPPAGEDG